MACISNPPESASTLQRYDGLACGDDPHTIP